MAQPQTLGTPTVINMKAFAVTIVIDIMETYYRVSMRKFMDDFSVLIVEQCLMRELSSIFTPDIVGGMTDKKITQLALEDPEVSSKCIRLTKRFKVLKDARDRL